MRRGYVFPREKVERFAVRMALKYGFFVGAYLCFYRSDPYRHRRCEEYDVLGEIFRELGPEFRTNYPPIGLRTSSFLYQAYLAIDGWEKDPDSEPEALRSIPPLDDRRRNPWRTTQKGRAQARVAAGDTVAMTDGDRQAPSSPFTAEFFLEALRRGKEKAAKDYATKGVEPRGDGDPPPGQDK